MPIRLDQASQVSKETAIREARGADNARFGNALALSSASLHVSGTSLARQSMGVEDLEPPLEQEPKEKKKPLAERLVDASVAQRTGVAFSIVSSMTALLYVASHC
jgi:hypothetical protein